MPWFKVDDSFYDHPKIFDAPDCALALWVRAGTWAARNLTEGFVPLGMPARLCDDPETAVRELVDRRLWRRTKRGYQFHDWLTYQLSREEVQAAREKMASGGTLGNHRRWHVDKSTINPDCRFCQQKQHRDSDRVPDQVGEGVGDRVPNPPVPSRPLSTPVRTNPEVVGRAPPQNDRRETINYEDLAARLHPLIGIVDAGHARRVADTALAGSNGAVANPTNYVLTAVAREPARFRPANTPPHVRDLCRHGLVSCQECP